MVGAFVQSPHLLYPFSHLLLLQMLPTGKAVYYFVDVDMLVECAQIKTVQATRNTVPKLVEDWVF